MLSYNMLRYNCQVTLFAEKLLYLIEEIVEPCKLPLTEEGTFTFTLVFCLRESFSLPLRYQHSFSFLDEG